MKKDNLGQIGLSPSVISLEVYVNISTLKWEKLIK